MTGCATRTFPQISRVSDFIRSILSPPFILASNLSSSASTTWSTVPMPPQREIVIETKATDGEPMSLAERISQDEMFMLMAEVVATRSTCTRLHVGVILTDMYGFSVVSMGYNGNARGLPNRCDSATPGACGCIHAELNALIKAPFGVNQPLTAYTTHSPCSSCAKLLLNSAVKRVVYRKEYRMTVGIDLLASQGIETVHLPKVDGVTTFQES